MYKIIIAALKNKLVKSEK